MSKLSYLAPLLALALLHPSAAAAQATSISGTATVQDTDILIINKQRVILWGVDGPERGQLCHANGNDWLCYDAAKRALETLSGAGEVTCRIVDKSDPFGRLYGVCESGGEEINADMVKQGMALAYTLDGTDYVDDQAEAEKAKVGLWQDGVEFIKPWDERRINSNTPDGQRS